MSSKKSAITVKLESELASRVTEMCDTIERRLQMLSPEPVRERVRTLLKIIDQGVGEIERSVAALKDLFDIDPYE